jgi:hypothetical protein
MNITEKLGLNTKGHIDIDFIDINLDTDISLYLDPTLINGLPTEWCMEASKVITNFFDNIFACCQSKDYSKLNTLIEFGKEPNETKLGQSVSQSRGKGSKPESLYKIFKSVSDQCFIEKGMIKNPPELCLFVKNFAEDRMSDLITNIIRKQLYEFTVSQCEKYSIDLALEAQFIGRYWNAEQNRWEKLIKRPLMIDGSKVLLVPKIIVRKKLIVSVAQYIQKQVLTHRQAYHLDTRTGLVHERYSKKKGYYLAPPTKKEVYAKEIKGCDHKEYARIFTEKNPRVIDEFRNQRVKETEILEYVLSDYELDYYVYGKKVRTA